MEKTLSPLSIPTPRPDVDEPGIAHPGRKRLIALAAVVLFAALGLLWWRLDLGPAAPTMTYRTAQVERGNITQTVSATGPLSAIATVNVGSQVSGNIAKLHVDFNDQVRAGQLIAEIDPSTYEARAVEAEGDLLAATVALELRQVNQRRNETLYASRMVSQSDYDQSVADLHQQEAVVRIKEAAVKSAKVDLERTQIRSPVDGVVIDRAVDVGQTVQASFAAPTLFIIAQDLRRMQITANVSEADIGGVVADRPVTFTVDAFPGETFSGQVRQVRNNTTTTNNVVTYPTIITVDNPELKLRPGMTANVLILIAQRESVLRIPNAALRFRPAEASAQASFGRQRVVYLPTGAVGPDGRTSGELQAVPVQVGLSDAAFTEITSGLEDVSAVVTGVALLPTGAKAASTPTNPFMPKVPAHGQKR